MSALTSDDYSLFRDAIEGLKAGDFSRLESLFNDSSPVDTHRCRIIEWYEAGLFVD